MDKLFLESKLVEKLSNDVVRDIVTETFLTALPFNAEAITESAEIFTKYSNKVVTDIGGMGAIESALTGCSDPIRRGFLNTMKKEINVVVAEAAKRIVVESAGTTDKLTDIVDKAALTEDELKKLAAVKLDIGHKDIASIISKKVVSAIAGEKEAYEQDAALQKSIEDALVDAKTQVDSTLEGYCDRVLTKKDPRHYISLFSKMVDNALEALMNVAEDIDELSLPVLESVTDDLLGITSKDVQETTMNALHVRAVYGRACEGSEHEDGEGREKFIKKMSNAAMVSTITMYTMLETLKTMNIFTPSQTAVQSFVDRGVDLKNILIANDETVIKQASTQLDILKMHIGQSKTAIALEDRCKTLEAWKTVVSELPPKFATIREAILPKINDTIEFATARANAISDTGTSFETSLESVQYQRDREYTLGEVNRLHTLYEKNKNVTEIRFRMNSAMESATGGMSVPYVDVDIMGFNNDTKTPTKIGESYIPYRHIGSAGRVLDVFRDIVGGSKLAGSSKKVTMYNTDTCKFV